MPRYKLTVEYDGTPYAGWQRQEHARTPQGELQRAIAGFSGETVTAFGAGRTDTGVHALGQVVHIDLAKDWPCFTVQNAINTHLLPEPISVVACELAAPDFDARFSATERAYRYIIRNRRAPLTLEQNRAWQVSVPLDETQMHAAAQHLVGRHDFTTFRSSRCQAESPVRSISSVSVTREGERVLIEVRARSFLHNQVRSIAGSLRKVGDATWPVAQFGDALKAANRKRCGPVAPPGGLYLVEVRYDGAAKAVK